MKSWVKSDALRAKSGVKTFAAMVLGPLMALQGCTKEEPQNTTATAIKASAMTGASGSSQSAAPGPSLLAQTYQKTAVPIAWRTFTGTNLSLTDDSIATITSPFPILFAGGTGVTSVKAGMNGAITFTGTSLTFINTAIPTTAFATLVAPFWDDLYPGPTTADNVYWGVQGTAPNRELVVEWRNVYHRDARTATIPDTLTFQVVFFEDSPDILFNYKDVLVGVATLDKGASATVGVANTTTDANQHSYLTASLSNDTAYLWQWITPSTAPVAGAVTTTPTTLNEGDALTVTSSFTDADGAASGPWKVQVDTDYVSPNFSTDFSATSAAEGPVTVTGTVRTSGNTTLGLRVMDKGGIISNISTVALTVVDVPPSLTALAVSGPATELAPVTLTSSFADPGLDSPWKVQWDFDYDGTTFTVDQETTASAPGAISLSHAFANDGTFTVGLRITDKDGVQSPVQTLAVTVADLAPSLSGIFGGTDLLEGAPLELSAVFTDPGDHSKPWKLQWDFDYDGTTFDIDEEEQTNTAGTITLSREARDSGNLRYALRVVDNDGSKSPVQTIIMNIAEANPVLSSIDAVTLTGGGMEPSTVSFALEASSGAEKEAADPIRGFLWDFDGDGTFDYASATPFALYTYRDNKADGGAYTATVRVMDEDTYSEEQVSINIQNVAPTLSAPATADVLEGTLLALRVSAVDPGNDALTFSLSGAPAGMSLTQDGLLLWTPSFQQTNLAGKPYAVTVMVADDDGATASTTIALIAKSRDFDSDGMADTWEVAHGLNPTVDDAAGDLNGDGVSNLTQYLSENGGPRTPSAAVVSGPLSGAKVSTAQIVLTTQNVADAGDLNNVKYQFQVFADAALTTLVRDVTVDQAAAASTSATLTDGTESATLVDLTDDQAYSWRVRAVGTVGPDTMHGPWSDAQRFTYNPTNDAPAAARGSQPLSGSQVSTDKPVLTVDNAIDVDDEQLTYTFEVAENATLTQGLISSAALPAGTRGSTSWLVSTALKPFGTYYWRVTAKDPHGATSQSEVASFTVYIGRPGNREPGVPALTAVATVASLTPELVADAATDADGDALTYTIEVDSSATFTSPAHQASASLKSGQDGKVRFTPAALTENMRYYWRVRALDPYAASDWMVGSFIVNAQNDAPLAPVALNPSDAIIYNRKPTLLVQNSADPEGDAVTYSFEVRTAGGDVVDSGDVAAGANGHTAFTVTTDLNEGEEYVWAARGKDSAGAVGQASEAKFQVYKAPEVKDGGCSAGAGALGGMLPLVAMALGMLRRRRQS